MQLDGTRRVWEVNVVRALQLTLLISQAATYCSSCRFQVVFKTSHIYNAYNNPIWQQRRPS